MNALINKRKSRDTCWTHNKRTKTDTINDFSDVSKAYDYLRSLFATEKFSQKIVPIVWRHQLYAICHNKTLIDRQLNTWSKSSYIRLFRLGSTADDNEVAVVLMSDFQELVDKCCPKTIITERYLKKVIYEKHSTHISCDVLKNEYQFNEENIIELVRIGLLARHLNVGQLLVSIPNVGEFVKTFHLGRNTLISIIKKNKYKEILKSELMKKRYPKNMKLSVEYHINDLIGSQTVEVIKTSNDLLLRLL
ncbi:serine/threonine-protein kinase 19-like [Oppia nitens]|uniref:serine/threonine-protein kinase 19-like n=1 Tax=Oppia nitens TaxID=1686743 RepID=UPI0023DAAEF6|nr:serine/threonine-protein kinase 19-like [Oppia nitens]